MSIATVPLHISEVSAAYMDAVKYYIQMKMFFSEVRRVSEVESKKFGPE
jgi:hypothetical protein